ncbi:M28 family peptidase [Symbioplanes lichenis]|uniref:M28 family peptidase n=1 Tax=Symbioplanes lichenis TaxID=1629072 RepID=UPI0027399FD7|nr:M28 family peptidase [Actinoplanes lichenis]
MAADRAFTHPRRRGWAALAVVAALTGLGAYALASIRPPAARPADAPAAEFSAGRAFAHVEAVAARPHPLGSPANDAVREQLVATLRGLGLDARVQDTVSVQGAALSSSAGGASMARVRNIVALLPGTAPTGRVFLVAHYDSVQNGPGANDDASGVAAVLETARALVTGPRPRNDIVLVLTDGEEGCLCGAKAFADQHPYARQGGIVLNLEARGSAGPSVMFETAARNAGLIGVFGRAPHPIGTSLAVEVYRMMPNNTDFTAFLGRGFTGLNSAYIEGVAWYHTPLDTPSTVDRGTLQQEGDNLLALARELGDENLPALRSGQDATYFPLLGGLARYPGALTWPIAAAAVLAVLALAWLIRRRGLASARRQAVAFATALGPLLLAPALAQLLWLTIKTMRPGYAEMPVDPYRPWWYRLAVVALTLATVFAWYAVLRRRLSPAALALAGLAWLAVLGIVLAAVAPGGSYLTALPALAGALAGLGARHPRGWLPPLLVTVAGGVAVVVLLPTLVLFFPALGMNLAAAGAFLTALLAFALLPVADLLHPAAGGQRGLVALRARRAGALPTVTALVATAACVAAGMVTDRFDARHPEPTHLMYALDADTGQARWLSESADLSDWTAGYVSGEPAAVTATLPAFGDEKVRSGPAPAAPLPAPAVTVLSSTDAPQGRTVRLRLVPGRDARLVTLHVAEETTIVAATAGGQPVPVGRKAGGGWGFGFVFHAPAEGVEVTLTAAGAGPMRLRLMSASDGLTGLPGFQPRPATVGVAGTHTSDMLTVAKTQTI